MYEENELIQWENADFLSKFENEIRNDSSKVLSLPQKLKIKEIKNENVSRPFKTVRGWYQ